jgi:hypothetical protein
MNLVLLGLLLLLLLLLLRLRQSAHCVFSPFVHCVGTFVSYTYARMYKIQKLPEIYLSNLNIFPNKDKNKNFMFIVKILDKWF